MQYINLLKRWYSRGSYHCSQVACEVHTCTTFLNTQENYKSYWKQPCMWLGGLVGSINLSLNESRSQLLDQLVPCNIHMQGGCVHACV